MLRRVGTSAVHQVVETDCGIDVSVLHGKVFGVGINALQCEIGAHHDDMLTAKFFGSIHVMYNSSRNQ